MSILLVTILAYIVSSEAATNTHCICNKWKEYKKELDNKTNQGSSIWGVNDEHKKKDIEHIYKYDQDLQDMVNLQIRIELHAFYNYLAMSRFFTRFDQDRAGFAKYFRAAANEELEHAEEFMKYQQMRGGEVKLMSIPPPKIPAWTNGLDVLKTAFQLEKNVTDQILCLHTFVTEKFKDTDFANFLEDKIIPEQYTSMKEIMTHIKSLERACPKAEKGGSCDAYPLYELGYDDQLKK